MLPIKAVLSLWLLFLTHLKYDFRLPPQLLESRDHFFSKTKLVFEDIVALNGEASVVIAHSLGTM